MSKIFLFFIFLLPLLAQAQFQIQCVDSNRVNPFYRCDDPTFNPTCGCDNVTYRNSCEMTNIGGVEFPSQFENGVCRKDLFYHFISPNPATTKLDFRMQFAEQSKTSVTIQIIDVFGNVVLARLLNNVEEFSTPPQTIFLSDIETGVYTFIVRAGVVFKVTKFVKYTL